MENLESVSRYFYNNLGIAITPLTWEQTNSLPLYLQDNYIFKTIRLQGAACLLAFDLNPAEQSPSVIRRHLDQLVTKFNGLVIYVRMNISSHNRKRLIQQKVPFVIPGNQMYLPPLGIDLREHFKPVKILPDRFSPAAQISLIYLLLGDFSQPLRPKELALKLGYSAMTMSRVFNEIETVAEITKQGRERLFHFQDGKLELWNRIAPRLSNPVQNRLPITAANLPPHSPKAGWSALSYYSTLADPDIPVYAIRNGRAFTQIKESQCDPDDQGAVNVEIWLYDPQICAVNGYVDPLSLYLSFRDNQDARVESALEELLRRLGW